MLSAAEVGEVRDFIRGQRTSDEPFDIAVGGYSGGALEYEEQFGAYERNGLTWWFERFDPSRGLSFSQTRELIAAGPPIGSATAPGPALTPEAEAASRSVSQREAEEEIGVRPSDT
jgi:hypothetical protein